MRRTLMVGNGVNRINNTESWQKVLEDLVRYVEKQGAFSIDGKPFSLLYEEILLRAIRFRNKNEKELKEYVCRIFGELIPNEFHKKILSIGVENIITTNYDYNLENVINNQDVMKIESTHGHSKERLYRLHTYNQVIDKKIWHIHGEVNFPDTVVLGHEKYSRVLRKMIKYVNDKKDYWNKEESWIDLFFKTDVHILGLSLDYTEIDLWWLINFRARLKRMNKDLRNTIVYYMPVIGNKQKDEKKSELLFAHDVEVEEIKAINYSDFYSKVLDKLYWSQDNRYFSA